MLLVSKLLGEGMDWFVVLAMPRYFTMGTHKQSCIRPQIIMDTSYE